MKLKEYLKKKKITQKAFAEKLNLHRFSILRYTWGEVPAPRVAWKIFNETDGQVSFEEMGYEAPPKNPLKDI